MIANETTIYQSTNKVDEHNYRQLYAWSGLQQREKPIPCDQNWWIVVSLAILPHLLTFMLCC